MTELNRDSLAKMIDHTRLSPHAREAEIAVLCEEAKRFGFCTVCVNSCHTRFVSKILGGSSVGACTVIGFPLGATSTKAKACEAENAVADGAAEIDMVINVGALRDRQFDRVYEDIKQVVGASGPSPVKVILETCYLTDEDIVTACRLSLEAGAQFVKTSTGFGAFGAFADQVRLMRQSVGSDFGVKASGGIRTVEDALRMVAAGANRLGTSSGVAILTGLSQIDPNSPIPDDPCLICSAFHAAKDKLPGDIFQYYQNKCQNCPSKDNLNRLKGPQTTSAY